MKQVQLKHNSEGKDSKVDETFAASKAANEDPIDKAREELPNDTEKDEVVEITPVAVVNATDTATNDESYDTLKDGLVQPLVHARPMGKNPE